MNGRKAFTLVELLVVIAIIDLLFIQKSCWWKLNYTPPYSPPF
ncbi:MAG TPA: type II secretion system protein [Sedimentisphaerales bacterium]|nr:type II secretion system protein [Sedimentisphaerales bacterium]